MQWRIDTPGRFYDAGEESVVYYDPASGDTHLLSAFASFLVQQFPAEPTTLPKLIQLLSPLIDSAGEEDEFSEAVSSVLHDLAALDIVQQA